jgi:hypothetical protein
MEHDGKPRGIRNISALVIEDPLFRRRKQAVRPTVGADQERDLDDLCVGEGLFQLGEQRFGNALWVVLEKIAEPQRELFPLG